MFEWAYTFWTWFLLFASRTHGMCLLDLHTPRTVVEDPCRPESLKKKESVPESQNFGTEQRVKPLYGGRYQTADRLRRDRYLKRNTCLFVKNFTRGVGNTYQVEGTSRGELRNGKKYSVFTNIRDPVPSKTSFSPYYFKRLV